VSITLTTCVLTVTDWRVEQKRSSDSLSRIAVPAVIVEMKVPHTCRRIWRTHTHTHSHSHTHTQSHTHTHTHIHTHTHTHAQVQQQPIQRGVMPGVDQHQFELSKQVSVCASLQECNARSNMSANLISVRQSAYVSASASGGFHSILLFPFLKIHNLPTLGSSTHCSSHDYRRRLAPCSTDWARSGTNSAR
jgi:hypothetical protein